MFITPTDPLPDQAKDQSCAYPAVGTSMRLAQADGYTYDAGPMKKPHAATVGDCTVMWADGTATIKVGDKATFAAAASKITGTVAGTSVTISDGRVDLGGTGGSPVTMQAGFSTKVFAVT